MNDTEAEPGRGIRTREAGAESQADPLAIAAGLAALETAEGWRGSRWRRPRCAPIAPTGRIFRHGAPASASAPFPAAPTTLAAYLASQAESHAPTTIRRRLAAISQMHRFNNLPSVPATR